MDLDTAMDVSVRPRVSKALEYVAYSATAPALYFASQGQLAAAALTMSYQILLYNVSQYRLAIDTLQAAVGE